MGLVSSIISVLTLLLVLYLILTILSWMFSSIELEYLFTTLPKTHSLTEDTNYTFSVWSSLRTGRIGTGGKSF